jgi:hypothetical protein
MIRSRATSRAVGKWIAAAPVLLLLACNSLANSPAVEPVTVGPGMQYSGDWDTPLPPGVSSNPDSFLKSFAVTKGVKHTRKRAGACPGCTVDVEIRAINSTSDFGPGSPPSSGRAVAFIQNTDRHITEAYYGFRPSAQADYYFWVDKRPDADSSRMTVLEVPKVGTLVVRAGRQKNLEYCHKYPPYPPGYNSRPDADFLEYKPPCTAISSSAKSKIIVASLLSSSSVTGFAFGGATALQTAMLVSEGGWIDCNSGCCK